MLNFPSNGVIFCNLGEDDNEIDEKGKLSCILFYFTIDDIFQL